MAKILICIVTFIINCTIFTQTAYSKPSIDSVKMIVAQYFDKIYGNSQHQFQPCELNQTFEIVDLISGQPISKEIRTDRIYYCAVYGDDNRGIYFLFENNSGKLISISNVKEFKVAWDFMLHNNYTSDQINTCINNIVKYYEYDLYMKVQ